jgi:CubicO group peptidase (beta-lactamase class C family)
MRTAALLAGLTIAACGSSPGPSAPPADPSNPGAPVVPGSDGGVAEGGTAPPAPDAAGQPTEPPPACATDLAPWLTKLNVPGLSAGIIKNGRLACTAVAGMANIDQNRPVTADTLFCVASVSKTITATAVMQAVDDGKLALDDDVGTHLSFPVRVPGCDASTVTLRELLVHTSSITDNPRLINCPGDCKYGSSLVSTVTRGADSPIALSTLVPGYFTPGGPYYDAANFLSDCPGTTASYSNMGVVLAGYMVEAKAGIPLETFTKARIFDPLGMKETAWKLSEIDPSHLAMPYDYAKSTGFTPYGQFGEPDWPDGMLRTSVPELARFLMMFMQRGEYGGARILKEATADEMRKVQSPDLDDSQGLVWFYDDFGASRPKVLGHDGADNGVSANMYFDPADGAGVILMSNGIWNDTSDDLMEALFKESTAY